MAEHKTPNSEFVICVLKPDLKNTLHIIIHPVLLVCNKASEPYVSPESVIGRFKLFGGFQNSKIISISANQVSKKNWKLLKEGVKDSEISQAGVQIEAELLHS